MKFPKIKKVESWGMNHFSHSPVFYPENEKELRDIFSLVQKRKLTVSFKGSGCSYGDAFTNQKGAIIDLSKFNRILDFNEKTNILTAQSGTTLKQVWEYCIEKKFWPPVVSGTMHTSLGGILSMNIHGKNNFSSGTIGEYVTAFSMMTIDGKVYVCTPDKNKDLFYSTISSFGMLGCFLNISLKMKKIYSGKVKVVSITIQKLSEMFEYFEKNEKDSDYLVGWIDAFGNGKNLGCGIIHKANFLKEGEDKDFPKNCSLKQQILPSFLLGILPKSILWIFMYPFSHFYGIKLINRVKYLLSKFKHNKTYFESHAQYAFLLDYVPNWKYIYKPGGLIQYQCFLPKKNAQRAFEEILQICQKESIVSWLAVFKKHRPDSFLLTHSLDGFSLALDFPFKKSKKNKLWNLTEKMDQIVLKYKGKFYFAKDITLKKEYMKKIYSSNSLEKFYQLKKIYDPQSHIESDIYRRLFK